MQPNKFPTINLEKLQPCWVPFAKGMMVMFHNPETGIFALKMVSADMKRIVFDQEVYEGMVLLRLDSNFVAFEGQYGMLGICFPEGYDVDLFIEKFNKVKSIWANPILSPKSNSPSVSLSKSVFAPPKQTFQLRKSPFHQKSNSDSESFEKNEENSSPKSEKAKKTEKTEKLSTTTAPIPQFEQKSGKKFKIFPKKVKKGGFFKNLFGMKKSSKKSSKTTEKPKIKIGNPNDFTQVGHIGVGEAFGEVPDQLLKIFMKANVKKEELADKSTLEFLKKTVQETLTPSTWNNILHPNNNNIIETPSPIQTKSPQQQPNQKVEEKQPVKKKSPPPIPTKKERKGIASPQSVQNKEEEMEEIKSPIVVKKRTPPPPPSNLILGNKQKQQDAVTVIADVSGVLASTAIPVPPPPPPPVKMKTNTMTATVSTAPEQQQLPQQGPGLLEEIRQGKKLRSVAENPPAGTDFLEEIRIGKKLRPVAYSPQPETKLTAEQESLAKILEIAMEKRRKQLREEEEDEEDEEDEEENGPPTKLAAKTHQSDWDE